MREGIVDEHRELAQRDCAEGGCRVKADPTLVPGIEVNGRSVRRARRAPTSSCRAEIAQRRGRRAEIEDFGPVRRLRHNRVHAMLIQHVRKGGIGLAAVGNADEIAAEP